jgi:molybdopterin synthase catalytic subunit
LRPGRPSVRFAVNGDYADADATLAEGDELACIPPVSGGGPKDDSENDPRKVIVDIRPDPFGPEILADLSEQLATDADGAVVGFLGRTRSSPGTPAPGQEAEAARHAGRTVDALEYEAHDAMAMKMLQRIAAEAEARFGVRRLAIVHRTGEVPLGDVSVAVVAVSSHRDAAFAAAKYAIDETKDRVPIWKSERFADGHVWIGAPARTGLEPAVSPDGARPDDAAVPGTTSRPAKAPGPAKTPRPVPLERPGSARRFDRPSRPRPRTGP